MFHYECNMKRKQQQYCKLSENSHIVYGNVSRRKYKQRKTLQCSLGYQFLIGFDLKKKKLKK